MDKTTTPFPPKSVLTEGAHNINMETVNLAIMSVYLWSTK